MSHREFFGIVMFCDGDMKWPLSFKEEHVVLGGGHSVGPPQPLIAMGYFYFLQLLCVGARRV